MGLFSSFKEYKSGRQEKRLHRAEAVITNPKAIKDDRWSMIMFLRDLGEVEKAVPILLKRFEYSLEHGINDTREKEAVLEAITSYGTDALSVVREYLLVTNRIAWPIKTLKALGDEDQVVEVLKSALDFGDIAFDQAKVDKNYDILCYLIDYPVPGFAEKLAHFLNDNDERVRYAAAEVLIEQQDAEVPGYLEHFLSDHSSENTRIRQAVLDAFLEKKWQLSKPEVFPNQQVDDRIFVTKRQELERRG